MAGIDKLIINSAYKEPAVHWKADANFQTFHKEPGRRPAGYFIAGQGNNQYNDIGKFVELPLVNKIRPRVKAWREAGYPGVTGITKKLLDHWHDTDARQYAFFFCQLDAMETLIWLVEAPESEKLGIQIPGDGGDFRRICTKMCTGGGKTTVMAMLIAWMICNKVTYPKDIRFTKYIFIVAPGLTVRSRLQVLQTGGEDNYYSQFNIVPIGLQEKLRQGIVKITNWQALAWESEDVIKKRKSVDKRGALSDEAYTREVLGELKRFKNILVINDEAHHAWRKNPEVKVALKGQDKKEFVASEEQATIWVSGLDRIHKTRHILTCYDFSATPFAPSGKRNDEEALFSWIVSDFGLNDGIESGLVKTPRVVVRDDGIPSQQSKNFRSKLYHIYMDSTVKDDINRDAEPNEPLPDLLRQAYYLLGKDWLDTYKTWQHAGSVIPPVLISVVNRTETAARIKYAFDHQKIDIPELCEKRYTLRIDSKIMENASLEDLPEGIVMPEDKVTKTELSAMFREIVDTVGKKGQQGEQIRNVVSVGMLSEGWDAKTVTHILGLRAFSSQLLCEQVVGRGLRRTSYDIEEGSDMFSPEYVNIFGIPFTFLPHEGGDTQRPVVTKPKTQVEVVPEKARYEISWPNIVRLDRMYKQKLSLDVKNVPPMYLDLSDLRFRADLAPILDGVTDLNKCTEIDLEKLDRELRMQRIIFDTAGQVYDQAKAAWKEEGTKYFLLGQVILLTEQFLKHGKIVIKPALINPTPLRTKIAYMMNMNKIVNHLWSYIRFSQVEKTVPVYDMNKKIRSTKDMQTWFTTKPCNITQKCHISHCVYDSSWEATESYEIEKNPHVKAWVKNDHLGFEIVYVFEGVVRKYRPDFLITLDNGTTLVLEVKGQETRKDIAKRQALEEWIQAVNGTREYGVWHCDVSYHVKDVDEIIQKYI